MPRTRQSSSPRRVPRHATRRRPEVAGTTVANVLRCVTMAPPNATATASSSAEVAAAMAAALPPGALALSQAKVDTFGRGCDSVTALFGHSTLWAYRMGGVTKVRMGGVAKVVCLSVVS